MQSVKSTEQGQKKGEMRMYENRTVEEVCREFSVDLRTGLSAAEVEVRQRHYGENELREAPPRSLIVRIGAQLCDSLIFVLFAAAGISLLLGEYGDAGVILAVVVLNATVGVIQEGKAEKALESLKRMTQLEAVVIREGKEREIARAGAGAGGSGRARCRAAGSSPTCVLPRQLKCGQKNQR